MYFDLNKIHNDQTLVKAQAEFKDRLSRLESTFLQSRYNERALMEELNGIKNNQKTLEKKYDELFLKVKYVKDINKDYRKELHNSRYTSAKLSVDVRDCETKCGKLASEFDSVKTENKDFRFELLNEARGKIDILGIQVNSVTQMNSNLESKIDSIQDSLEGTLLGIKHQLVNIKYENKDLRLTANRVEKVQTDLNRVRNVTAEDSNKIATLQDQIRGKIITLLYQFELFRPSVFYSFVIKKEYPTKDFKTLV